MQYEVDGEYEEMDFHELMQVLMMGKQFGDPGSLGEHEQK